MERHRKRSTIRSLGHGLGESIPAGAELSYHNNEIKEILAEMYSHFPLNFSWCRGRTAREMPDSGAQKPEASRNDS